MITFPRYQLIVGLGVVLFAGRESVFAWPKGVAYPDPKKVTARVMLPTPRQYSQGYDRQIVITALSQGVGVNNARLIYSNGKKSIPIVIPRDMVHSGQGNQAVVPLKLAQLPEQLGELRLAADVFLLDYSFKTTGYKTNAKGETVPIIAQTPADRINVVVRPKGQQITPLKLNTSRPFRIGEAAVQGPSLFAAPKQLDLSARKSKGPSRRTSASVLITLRNAKGEKRQPKGDVNFDDMRLVTANGEIHQLMDGKNGQIITQFTNDVDPNADEPVRYFFGCNFKHIPSSKGPITFKANVSVADSWVTPVSVRVR